MKPQAFMFVGRSGCGKGTQAALLIEALKKADPERPCLYVQTGQELRRFMTGHSHTAKLVKDILDRGGLVPEFLVVYLVSRILVERFDGNQHIIFDGALRKVHEAGVIDSVFDFYGLPKAWVLDIVISPEEALKRLLARKRFDDNEAEIKKRLSWYETDVVPTTEYFKKGSGYKYLSIDGERSVEDIHADIVKKVGLK